MKIIPGHVPPVIRWPHAQRSSVAAALLLINVIDVKTKTQVLSFLTVLALKTQFLRENELRAERGKRKRRSEEEDAAEGEPWSCARQDWCPQRRLRRASGRWAPVSAGGLKKICKERVGGKINVWAPCKEHKNENSLRGITSNIFSPWTPGEYCLILSFAYNVTVPSLCLWQKLSAVGNVVSPQREENCWINLISDSLYLAVRAWTGSQHWMQRLQFNENPPWKLTLYLFDPLFCFFFFVLSPVVSTAFPPPPIFGGAHRIEILYFPRNGDRWVYSFYRFIWAAAVIQSIFELINAANRFHLLYSSLYTESLKSEEKTILWMTAYFCKMFFYAFTCFLCVCAPVPRPMYECFNTHACQ